LCAQALPLSRLGRFRGGHNGFGLKGEIAINRRCASDLPVWELLGELLRELLHAWQAARGTAGRGNYPNRELRQKAAGLGLIIDRRGRMGYSAAGPFKDLLRRHGVAVAEGEIGPRRRRKGDSKLKKWTCGCTNVWCAVSNVQAQCLKCGQVFGRAETGADGSAGPNSTACGPEEAIVVGDTRKLRHW
jgi:hypothetical protein